MSTVLHLAFDFVVWAVASYFLIAVTIGFYEDQRRSRSEVLTEQEKKENGRAAGFVALCSSLLLSVVHLVVQIIQLQAK